MTARVILAVALVFAQTASPTPASETGAEIYQRYCEICHGADGRPNLPSTPDFTRGEGLLKSDQELVNSLRFGVGSMPGFEHQLDKKGFIDVIFYIRSLQR